jgi:hypothetical protein
MSSEQNAHEPLVERVLVGFDLAAEHHVANCPPCLAERERLEDALRQFGAANREYALRGEDFWERQAAQIRQKRREASGRMRVAAGLAPVLATLLLVGVLLVHRAPRVEPSAQTAPAVQTVSDHELLLAVERAVESDTPQALAPMAWVEEESDGNMPSTMRSNQKENRSHEN